MSRSRRYKSIGLTIVIVLVLAAQVFQPRPSNPPIDPTRTIQNRLAVPPDVGAVMDRSCRDCHTNATTWPWYSKVSPASWLVVSDVNEGREHLNFSDWASYDAKRVDHELDEICEHVRGGEMPLSSYTWMHPAAKLSAADVDLLCGWTERTRAAMAAPVGGIPQPSAETHESDGHTHEHSHAEPHSHGTH
jgi:hypothetical protein